MDILLLREEHGPKWIIRGLFPFEIEHYVLWYTKTNKAQNYKYKIPVKFLSKSVTAIFHNKSRNQGV